MTAVRITEITMGHSTTSVLWLIGGAESAPGRWLTGLLGRTAEKSLSNPGDETTRESREQPTPHREAYRLTVSPNRCAPAHDRTTHTPWGLDQAASSSIPCAESLPGRKAAGADESLLGPEPGNTLCRRPIRHRPRASPATGRRSSANRASFRSRASDGSSCLIHRYAKAHCMLFVRLRPPLRPTEDTLFMFNPNLTRALRKLQPVIAAAGHDKPINGRMLWRSCRQTGGVGWFILVGPFVRPDFRGGGTVPAAAKGQSHFR